MLHKILNFRFSLSDSVKPAILPASTSITDYANTKAIVTGWGKVENRIVTNIFGRKRNYGKTSDILQEVAVPVWDNSKCASSYGRCRSCPPVLDTNLCAGEKGKDSCSVHLDASIYNNDYYLKFFIKFDFSKKKKKK